MATQKNQKDRVTTRRETMQDRARRAWGSEYDKSDIVYEFSMDDEWNLLIGDLEASTRNREYEALPQCIKSDMTEQEWLWYPDKSQLIDDMTQPECEED